MRKFQNMETQKLFDKTHGAEKGPKQPMKDEHEGGEHDHADVVAQHGKAHTINMKHDHAKQEHHVHSIHESGHSHKAQFGSAEEAHDHAAKMAGVGEPEEEAAEHESAPMGEMGGDHASKGAALGVGGY